MPIDGLEDPEGPAIAFPGPQDWDDRITGLPGPFFWRVVLEVESARARRYGRPVTVVLVEIVGLDRVATERGARSVNGVVRAVGQLLRANSRSSDYLARLERSRFGLLLPETDEVAAINFVERTRARSRVDIDVVDGTLDLAFGWASPTRTTDLLAAVAVAIDRLRREREKPVSPEP